MKNSNNKQRLSLLDLPPPIPAALDTLNLDYVADSYQPGQYELSDLPDKIPIINERTGSFRRFIKRKTPRDRRRIVSAPPGTILEKHFRNHLQLLEIRSMQLQLCHYQKHRPPRHYPNQELYVPNLDHFQWLQDPFL